MAIAVAIPAIGVTSVARAPARPSEQRVPPACAGAHPGRAAALFEAVPQVMSAHMTATRDGGAVISFALFRPSRAFPRNRFFVTAVDAAGCVRWRASLPGGWPIAQPVQAADGSIVAASAGFGEPGAAGGLRVYALSGTTGRVLRRTAFSTRTTLSGRAPTLIAGRHGETGVLTGGVNGARAGPSA